MSDYENEYIVEFISVGKAIKVIAIDPVSFREVSMIGAAGVSKDELARVAIRKLRYVLDKNSDENGQNS